MQKTFHRIDKIFVSKTKFSYLDVLELKFSFSKLFHLLPLLLNFLDQNKNNRTRTNLKRKICLNFIFDIFKVYSYYSGS